MSGKDVLVMNEQRALARLKRSDIGGLEMLVRLHQTRAVRTAYLIVRDIALAEDIVQSAFVRVYERIQQFDTGRPFVPWFLRIVANDAIKTARRGLNTVSLDAGDFDNHGPSERLIDNEPLPEALIEQAETSEKLWSLLGDLSPEQRAVVVLRYYAGLTSVDIADELNVPPGTVRWRLHAALNRLRGQLKLTSLAPDAERLDLSEIDGR